MKALPSYKYYKEIFNNVRKPFAFIDLDLLEENVNALYKRAGDKQIRIASKSVRCRHILDLLLNTDSKFIGTMAFTAEEAVYLSKKGFNDILIGYPTIDKEQVKAVCSEVKNGKQITLMVDSIEHLNHLNAIAREEQTTLPICIDMDMSTDYPGIHFGVCRSPIKAIKELELVLSKLKEINSLRLDGLMGYEAQIAGVGDNVKGDGLKNFVVKKLKNNSIPKIAKRRKEAIDLTKSMGFELRFVNAGGTGSLESSIQESDVTEVTIGSGFYNSHLFDSYQNFQHLPAAGFGLEIVRKPSNSSYTCLGGGYIASGATGIDKQPMPYLPNGIKLTKNEGTGEVQTPFEYSGQEKLAIGDTVLFRHAKAGELMERFNEVHLVQKGGIKETVLSYRGEGKAFL